MTARPPDSADTVIDQASAWVVRLNDESVADADYEAFDAWLLLDASHPDAFTRAEGLWSALDEDRSALDAALVRAAGGAVKRVPVDRGITRRRWSVGAGGLIAAGLLAAILVPHALENRTVVYATEPGQQRVVELSDGTRMIMNGGSRLTVRLTDAERRVEMDEAEVAFDVAHDTRRPFRIAVGQSRIEVLGTAFNVRRDAGSTRVAVARGLVSVTDVADASRTVRLAAGQTVERDDADGRMRIAQRPVEIAEWRSGRLVYDNRPLSEVAVDLSRAYATPVRAVGPAADLRFTGVLALDEQIATVGRLEGYLPVSVTARDDVIELRLR